MQYREDIRLTIIEAMYNDKDIETAISKMQPIELQNDLKQEMFLVLCEMDTEKLIQLYEKRELKYFLVRIMLNMIKSDRSTFFNKFRRQFEELQVNIDVQDEETNEISLNVVSVYINELHWYERELFSVYVETGKNVVRLSKETKIPYRSLIKTISKVKSTLKRKIKRNDNY